MWLLMPSVLLVWQIPYRALSLGLKVVIRRWSRLLFAGLCGLELAAARRWSVPSLTRRRVSLGRDWLGWASGFPFLRTSGLLSSVCAHCLERRSHGEFSDGFHGWWLPVPDLGASLLL